MELKRISSIFMILFSVSVLAVTGCKGGSSPHTEKVTLLQTTDMHDLVTQYAEKGGFSRLAARINGIRTEKSQESIPVVLVDSGDYTMGTVYDLLWDTDPAPFRFLQAMAYDVVTIGNHEYDYNPARLGIMISKAVDKGFNVPIVASNTVFDGAPGTDDDALEALASGTDALIVKTYVKTLDNGVVVGFIGLMGKTADAYAPNARPVTFQSNYDDSTVIAAIQATVDELRENCDIVVALSHSGVNSLGAASPAGDDITLAKKVSGIDIIASGHDHEMTTDVIEVKNTTTGRTAYIVCAGAYTMNLLQLDITVDVDNNKVADLTLTNNAIDSSITADSTIETMITGSTDGLDTELNALLSTAGLPALDEIVGGVAFNMPIPDGPSESGMGDLIADAFRWSGSDGSTVTFGACANGIIRNYYSSDVDILFSGLFMTLPLGMSMETDQSPLYPGYTLHKVYVTGAELWDICQFIAYIKQFDLDAYNPYFCCLSGLKFTYDPDSTPSAYAVTSVKYFGAADYSCTGSTAGDIEDSGTTTYPIIVDSYVLAMLLSDSIQGLLDVFGLSIDPKLSDETTLVTLSNMNQTRLDSSATAGTQEYQTWLSLYGYIYTSDTGALNGTIPSSPYNLITPARIISE